MLHRYSDINFVMQMDADLGLSLFAKALERERDARLFQQWTAQLPIMAYTGKNISFAEYRDRVTGANIDRRSVAEIQREIDEAMRELRKEEPDDGDGDLPADRLGIC